MSASIVFDLDGTLIDSAPDITAAVNLMLRDLGKPALDQATVVSFVGHGLPHLVSLVIDHCGLDPAQHGALCTETLKHYNASNSSLSQLYPGMRNSLDQLRDQGHHMGVCTNKPVEAAHHVLDVLDLTTYFPVVLGGDSLPQRKPDPTPLQAVFAALPAGPRVYVGDSEIDAETSQRAQVPFLLFTEGYRKTPVDQIPHTLAYDHAGDLPDCVAQALAVSAGN